MSLALGFALAGLGAWLFVAPATSREGTVAAGSTGPAWNASPGSFLARLEVVQLENQLVGEGYSVKVDGKLDPVTKSALADYLRISRAHPLSVVLARALDGTVITGRRNPSAWNSRFGLNRATRLVERPLTGSGGQLDANGNIRARPGD